MRPSRPLSLFAGLVLVLGTPLTHGATLGSDQTSPQPVGTPITFRIGGAGEAGELYRLSVAPVDPPGQGGLVQDYSRDDIVEWTRLDPGTYRVTASVLDPRTGQETTASQLFSLTPAVPPMASLPVALPTRHPLVALYVAPACSPPGQVRVRFFAPSVGVQVTSPKPCVSGMPVHFQVAGMRENTTYWLRHEPLRSDDAADRANPIPFTTGQAPSGIASGTTLAIHSDPSQTEPVVWHSPFIGLTGVGRGQATDLAGNLIWYLDEPNWPLRPSHDGTLWVLKRDPVTGIPDSLLAKVDLLGNLVRQTGTDALNYQLARLGYSDRINSIHHDARDLPNGHIAFIASVERLVTDVQGPGPVSVLGDMILVTDPDFQIKWVWNGWDHLDVTRLATLGEVCMVGGAGCPPFFLAETSNDWMHANGLAHTPDGNLILSVRHQDWVLKIHYADGAGDGRVLWRLGPDGDFTLVGGTEDDWFSHTHDPGFIGPNHILLFDNSNRRCAAASPPANCQSRGQVWEIDETAMTARPVFNQDLGEFAFAVGSAQQLRNGHYWFNSSMFGSFADPRTTLRELDSSGTPVYQNELDVFQYRSYRLTDLYSVPRSWNMPRWPERPTGCPDRGGRGACASSAGVQGTP